MNTPTLRTYKAGSIIYFIEDKGNEIFVLQKGKIILLSKSLDETIETREDVQKGEFFGVKSALGGYPREETVQVLADSTVLVFTPQLFEAFCMKNTRLVLQMLKVFSGQLRKVHRKVRELLGDTGQEENSIELLRVAEAFYKSSEADHSQYSFKAFLKNYPDSKFSSRAKTMIDLITKGQPYPVEFDSIDDLIKKFNNGNDDSFSMDNSSFDTSSMDVPDLDDFDHDQDMPDIDMASPSGDFDIPDMDLPDMDIPDFSAPAAPPPPVDISRLYYDGLNDFSREDWNGAIAKFENALSMNNFKNDSEAAFLEKSLYELGRTYMKKGEINTGIEKFSDFVKKYPRSQNIKKAMIFVAEGFSKKGDKQRALSLFNKVTQMPPQDKDSSYARQQMERLMKK
jgi:outer membrane protein assembly factor BamD (BamD/ComL family)